MRTGGRGVYPPKPSERDPRLSGQYNLKLFINVRMKPELHLLKVQLHLVKGGLRLQYNLKLFINVRMKPELHLLKVQLHLVKGGLRLDNII